MDVGFHSTHWQQIRMNLTFYTVSPLNDYRMPQRHQNTEIHNGNLVASVLPAL